MQYELVMDAKVTGKPVERSRGGHKVEISCLRRSGKWDRFEMVHKTGVDLKEGDFITIYGSCRSIMKKGYDYIDKGVVFAQEIELLDAEPEDYRNEICMNDVRFERMKEYRESKDGSGKMVLTYLVRHPEAHLLHITTWGGLAEYLHMDLVKEGEKYVTFRGRLQEHVSSRTAKRLFGVVTYYTESWVENLE